LKQRSSLAEKGFVKLSGFWQTEVMNTKTPSYCGFRFPSEIISDAIWLYHLLQALKYSSEQFATNMEELGLMKKGELL
jgi:hypothetical protein